MKRFLIAILSLVLVFNVFTQELIDLDKIDEINMRKQAALTHAKFLDITLFPIREQFIANLKNEYPDLFDLDFIANINIFNSDISKFLQDKGNTRQSIIKIYKSDEIKPNSSDAFSSYLIENSNFDNASINLTNINIKISVNISKLLSNDKYRSSEVQKELLKIRQLANINRKIYDAYSDSHIGYTIKYELYFIVNGIKKVMLENIDNYDPKRYYS